MSVLNQWATCPACGGQTRIHRVPDPQRSGVVGALILGWAHAVEDRCSARYALAVGERLDKRDATGCPAPTGPCPDDCQTTADECFPAWEAVIRRAATILGTDEDYTRGAGGPAVVMAALDWFERRVAEATGSGGET